MQQIVKGTVIMLFTILLVYVLRIWLVLPHRVCLGGVGQLILDQLILNTDDNLGEILLRSYLHL